MYIYKGWQKLQMHEAIHYSAQQCTTAQETSNLQQLLSNQFFKVCLTDNSVFKIYNNQTINWVAPLLILTKTVTTNLIFRQRQSFIFRAAIAHLHLSATLLIHRVGLSVIPSVLSNLLTIQLSKAAVASVRHPNDFQSRQRPLIISPQEHSLVPGLLFCLKGSRQARKMLHRTKEIELSAWYLRYRTKKPLIEQQLQNKLQLRLDPVSVSEKTVLLKSFQKWMFWIHWYIKLLIVKLF